MKTVKITAKTVDEAVAEGLRKLGATREESLKNRQAVCSDYCAKSRQ